MRLRRPTVTISRCSFGGEPRQGIWQGPWLLKGVACLDRGRSQQFGASTREAILIRSPQFGHPPEHPRRPNLPRKHFRQIRPIESELLGKPTPRLNPRRFE